MMRGCVIPQGGVFPSIDPFLVGKHLDHTPDAKASAPVSAPTKGKQKTPARKPPLTKAGQGSFTVYSAPKPKVTE
jgi:hypothetical protein